MQVNEVWSSTLDDRYRCSVISRSDPYQGRLIIRDGETTLHAEDVTIAFGAPFGPDAADVAYWEKRCVEVISAATK